MTEEIKLKYLKTFLNIFGAVSLILFGTLILFTATNSPLMQDGGILRFLRWDMPSPHVEVMLESIYFVWGIFLLKAAKKPNAYVSFLSFTAWANLVHGLVMVPQSLMTMGFTYKLFTDTAYCIILAVGIWMLMPKGEE